MLNADVKVSGETTLRVAGMDCPDEVAAIERVLKPLFGVREVREVREAEGWPSRPTPEGRLRELLSEMAKMKNNTTSAPLDADGMAALVKLVASFEVIHEQHAPTPGAALQTPYYGRYWR